MLRLTTATLLLLVSAACGAPEAASNPAPEPAQEPTPMKKIDVSALAIPYASQSTDGMLCAGQISPEQMDALAAAGYRSFISLRVAGERGAGWEEAHASDAGLHFVRMPIAGADDINEESARSLSTLLDAQEGPVVLYCGSSNRVGALLGLKAFLVDGAAAEEAATLGKTLGATSLEPLMRTQLGL